MLERGWSLRPHHWWASSQSIHWLRVPECIQYKIAVLTKKGSAPRYRVADLHGRRLVASLHPHYWVRVRVTDGSSCLYLLRRSLGTEDDHLQFTRSSSWRLDSEARRSADDIACRLKTCITWQDHTQLTLTLSARDLHHMTRPHTANPNPVGSDLHLITRPHTATTRVRVRVRVNPNSNPNITSYEDHTQSPLAAHATLSRQHKPTCH